MERYISYNEEFKLMICRTCRYGLSTNYIGDHFRIHHNASWREHRVHLIEYVQKFSLLAVDALERPDAMREPVDGLKIHDGWCCGEDECCFCSLSEKHVENHCRKEHGSEATKQKAWFRCRMQTLLGKPYIRYLSFMSVNEANIVVTFQLSRRSLEMKNWRRPRNQWIN